MNEWHKGDTAGCATGVSLLPFAAGKGRFSPFFSSRWRFSRRLPCNCAPMATFVMIAVISLLAGGCVSLKRACPVCGATLFNRGESNFDGDSLNSPAKTFHHYGLHAHAEAYLVCIYKVEKTGGAINEMRIKATVIDHIKGSRKLGSQFIFTRLSDGSHEEVSRTISNLQGGLFYVFLDVGEDGQAGVDAQDPIALWKYTEELREVVARHMSKCQADTPINRGQRIRSETNRTSSATPSDAGL